MVIQATRTGGVIETSYPNRTSLVEVKQVEILATTATDAEIGTNTGTNTGPGGGTAAHVDATAAGGNYRSTVTVHVTTEPPLNGEVPDVFVAFKVLDVDDPYAPPPHMAGDLIVDPETSPAGNRGDPPCAPPPPSSRRC